MTAPQPPHAPVLRRHREMAWLALNGTPLAEPMHHICDHMRCSCDDDPEEGDEYDDE